MLSIIRNVIRIVVVCAVSMFSAKKLEEKLDNNWLRALVSVSIGHMVGIVVVIIANYILYGGSSFGLWIVPIIGNIYAALVDILSLFDAFSLFGWFGFFDTVIILIILASGILYNLVTLALIPIIANKNINSAALKAAKPVPSKMYVCQKCGGKVGANDAFCTTCGADLTQNKPRVI